MLAPITHILPLTRLRRARMLPSKGRILVSAGQYVTASDPVAESYSNIRHIILDSSSIMQSASRSKARRAIERQVGENVQEGDVIAQSGGIINRVLRAPASGTIVSIKGGQVMLQVRGAPFILKAGYSGTISEILPDRGVIIESSGVLVQGVWGNHRISEGRLQTLTDDPNRELTKDDLASAKEGDLVVAGYCVRPDVLQKVFEMPIKGLILGSVPSNLLQILQGAKLPAILVEGVGSLPLNQIAFRLLKVNETREASMNACQWDPSSGDRPEIAIPLPATGEYALETDIFRKGQTVRINAQPYAGMVGSLQAVRLNATRLPTGLRVPTGDIVLDDKTRVTVPLINLDVIE